MPTILESLYHGSLFPNEKVTSQDPSYHLISTQISQSIEAWKNKLSDGDFEKLESLLDLYNQIQGMEMTASFTCGFKLGVSMMIEVLCEE